MNQTLKRILKTKAIKLNKVDYEKVDNKNFVKNLRKKLNMTQRTFAGALGASIKTIEKWEAGNGNINNIALRLLYLLDKKPYLIHDIYPVEHVNISYDYNIKTRNVTVDGHYIPKNKFENQSNVEWKGSSLIQEGGSQYGDFSA